MELPAPDLNKQIGSNRVAVQIVRMAVQIMKPVVQASEGVAKRGAPGAAELPQKMLMRQVSNE